jgi:hypothetical protein
MFVSSNRFEPRSHRAPRVLSAGRQHSAGHRSEAAERRHLYSNSDPCERSGAAERRHGSTDRFDHPGAAAPRLRITEPLPRCYTNGAAPRLAEGKRVRELEVVDRLASYAFSTSEMDKVQCR